MTADLQTCKCIRKAVQNHLQMLGLALMLPGTTSCNNGDLRPENALPGFHTYSDVAKQASYMWPRTILFFRSM